MLYIEQFYKPLALIGLATVVYALITNFQLLIVAVVAYFVFNYFVSKGASHVVHG